MPITKSFLRTLKPNSAEYVVTHAKFQRKRGRNLSATFREIRNPKKAFVAAYNALVYGKIADIDPITVVEKITGVACTDSKTIARLSLAFHVNHCKFKSVMLQAANDTQFGSDLDEYIHIIGLEGFEKIVDIVFHDEDDKEEHFFIFYQDIDGLLLTFDSYGGNSVNGGNLYYNWVPNPSLEYGEYCHALSSHSSREYNGQNLFMGYHDCREALRQNISELRKYGTFVSTWIEQPFIWLLHYMDTKDDSYDYKSINKERISMMPQSVQDAIAGTQ